MSVLRAKCREQISLSVMRKYEWIFVIVCLSNSLTVCSCIARYTIVRRTSQSAIHSIPGWPVHSETKSTYFGNIQPLCNYCTNTINSHISTNVYSQVLIYTAEWIVPSYRERKCAICITVTNWIGTRASSIEVRSSIEPYRWQRTMKSLAYWEFVRIFLNITSRFDILIYCAFEH